MSYPTSTTGVPAATTTTYTSSTPGMVMAAPGATALPSSTTTTTNTMIGGSAAPGMIATGPPPMVAGVQPVGVQPVVGQPMVGGAPMVATTTSGDHGHHGSSHDSHRRGSTDKDAAKLEKEHLKQEKAAAKEHEKHEKQLAKEHEKHEKELHKQEAKAEKEHLKEEKRMEKERRHQWETAKKHRHDRYTHESKTLETRLRSDVTAWDTTHAGTAPAGYYNESVPDTLAYEGMENIGLFVAVPRARGLVEAKEKVDAYCKVVLVSNSHDGKEHVYATHKSSTVKNNANPEWWFHMDDTPHLIAEDHHWQQTGKLRIEVWDHDTFSKDDLLGSVEWPLQQLDGKLTRGNFQLQHNPNLVANKKARVHPTVNGSIWVEIRYRSPFAYSGMTTGAVAPAGYGYGTQHFPGGITTHSGYPAGAAVGTTGGVLGAGAAAGAIPVHASHAPIYQSTGGPGYVGAGGPGYTTGAPGYTGGPGYPTGVVGAGAPLVGAPIDNDPAHYRHPHHTGAVPGSVYKDGTYTSAVEGHHGTHHHQPGHATGVVPVGGVMPVGQTYTTGAPIVGAAPYTGTTVGGAPLPPASSGLVSTGGGAPGAVSVQVVTDAPASAAPQVAAAALAAAKAAADNVAHGGAAPAYVTQPGVGGMPTTTTTTTTQMR